MQPIMHFALSDCKRLLHHEAHYAWGMETPATRLRKARLAAGFAEATDAADALGIKRSTYTGHENGSRGYRAPSAAVYARKFKVSEEWLLFGKGDGEPIDPIPSAEVLERMVAEVIDAEVTMETKLADLPRIVGSGLREQLERYQPGASILDATEPLIARDRAARSRAPTRRDEQEESRTA